MRGERACVTMSEVVATEIAIRIAHLPVRGHVELLLANRQGHQPVLA